MRYVLSISHCGMSVLQERWKFGRRGRSFLDWDSEKILGGGGIKHGLREWRGF